MNNDQAMNPSDPPPDENEENSEPEDQAEETLAERSARLEAEAAAGRFGTDEGESEQPEAEEEEESDNPPAESGTIEALQNELNETKNHMMRALADAENTRKRAIKEREDASRFAISAFARDLLDVADNLRRALDAVPEDLIEADIRVKNLLDGIEATERELLRSFEKNNIEKLDPMDEVFDPNFHEVMFETPGTGKPAGTIIQVIETGYILNGRILRPARVGVAKDEGQDDGNEEAPPSTEPGGNLDTEA